MSRSIVGCVVSMILVVAVAKPHRATPPSDQPAPTAVDSENQDPATRDARAAIGRALPYLTQRTALWIEQQKCTSCQQVPHALWAMNEARASGFVIDERLAEWNRWATGFVLERAERNGPESAGERVDEIAQSLLGGLVVATPQDAAPTQNRLRRALELARDDDGRWRAGGRLPEQKRPPQETDEASTMWALLALQSASAAETEETQADPATPTESPSTSLEHLTLRYLVSRNDEERATAIRKELLSYQNNDGGWGWLLNAPSDALATGQALYALSYAPPERHTVRRAREFLVNTQQIDGSWVVPSTLKEMANQASEVSNDWGTAWAVIGLARTLNR